MTCTRRLLLSVCLLAATGLGPAFGAEPTQVKVETSAGDFVIQLDESRAPLSVANFLSYVRDGFYDGTIFHRVVNGFVIQGGGYTPDMTLKPPRPGVAN
jgi:peptidyl-prolyl cis-trans isomerase A (cyclophilin A)